MLHHVELYVSNLANTRAFWTPLLAHIGYQEDGAWDDGFTLAAEGSPYLTFVQVTEKHAGVEYHRCRVGLNHLAFKVAGRDAVDALKRYCDEHNVRGLYEERFPFANGGTDYYALFIEDPDRIKLEFVAA